MNNNNRRWQPILALVGALFAVPVAAIPESLQMVGLAVHQETGRDIYLGAIHADGRAPQPGDLRQHDGAKAMEYRVIARRTSIRSLLGSMLLQAELATGRAPDSQTAMFVDDIMHSVKGSLYAGDAFEITRRAGGETLAALNGYQLARTADAAVFDYLLHGWLGERGASSQFRSSLLATSIDSSLLASYRAHQTPSERIAVVGEWIAPPETPDLANDTSGDTALASTDEHLAGAEPAPEAVPGTAADTSEQTPALAQQQGTEPAPPTDTALDSPVSVALDPPMQLAMIAPQRSALVPDSEAGNVLALAHYSQRLAEFNSTVMRMVNGRIRYPRAAVRRNLEGSLELDLQLTAEGALKTAVVARSSGYRILDEAALSAAREAFTETALDKIDKVAVSEYRADDGSLLVPVPVNFILMQ